MHELMNLVVELSSSGPV